MATNRNQAFIDFLTGLGYYQGTGGQWYTPTNQPLNQDMFKPGGLFSPKHRRQFQNQELARLMPMILDGTLSIDDIMGGGFNTLAQGALMQILQDQQAGAQAGQDREDALNQLRGFLGDLDNERSSQDLLHGELAKLIKNPQMISDQEYGMLGAGMQETAARGAQDALMKAKESMAQRGLMGSGIAENQREQIMQEANNTALRNMRELNLQKANERESVFNMAQQGMLGLGQLQGQQDALRGNINSLIAQIFTNTNRQGHDLSGLISGIQSKRQDIPGMQAGTLPDYFRNT